MLQPFPDNLEKQFTHPNKINWGEIFLKYDVPLNICEEYKSYIFIHRAKIAQSNITQERLMKYKKYMCWQSCLIHNQYSEDFLKQIIDNKYWELNPKDKYAPNSYMDISITARTIGLICLYQKLSLDFIEAYKDVINFIALTRNEFISYNVFKYYEFIIMKRMVGK